MFSKINHSLGLGRQFDYTYWTKTISFVFRKKINEGALVNDDQVFAVLFRGMDGTAFESSVKFPGRGDGRKKALFVLIPDGLELPCHVFSFFMQDCPESRGNPLGYIRQLSPLRDGRFNKISHRDI